MGNEPALVPWLRVRLSNEPPLRNVGSAHGEQCHELRFVKQEKAVFVCALADGQAVVLDEKDEAIAAAPSVISSGWTVTRNIIPR